MRGNDEEMMVLTPVTVHDFERLAGRKIALLLMDFLELLLGSCTVWHLDTLHAACRSPEDSLSELTAGLLDEGCAEDVVSPKSCDHGLGQPVQVYRTLHL